MDIRKLDGTVIRSSDWRTDAGAAREKLTRGQSRGMPDAVISRHADGATGTAVPVPMTAQVSTGYTASPSGTTPEQDMAAARDAENQPRTPLFAAPPSRIFGNDDRVRATPTNGYPRSAIGQFTTGESSCSGVLYGPDVVVLAAHCLWNVDADRFFYGPWAFSRGQDGATENFRRCEVVDGFILAGYPANESNESYDMGAVQLSCAFPGTYGNGYYPLVAISAYPQTFIDGLYLIGYPANVRGAYVLGEQYEDSGRLIYDTSFLKTTNVDASEGQSGGPFAVPCNTWGWYYCTVGVISHQTGGFPNASMNTGHQFTNGGISALANFRVTPSPSDTLTSGATLPPGGQLSDTGGVYHAFMQGDGNFVLYGIPQPAYWSTATFVGGSRLSMNGDGNLVIYYGAAPICSTKTDSTANTGAILRLQSDGNVVIIAPGNRPIWSAYGGGRCTP